MSVICIVLFSVCTVYVSQGRSVFWECQSFFRPVVLRKALIYVLYYDFCNVRLRQIFSRVKSKFKIDRFDKNNLLQVRKDIGILAGLFFKYNS